MRIYAFTQYYPSTFKPYFDTQFAQLVRDGHELTIFAQGRQGRVPNEKVARLRLDARTRPYPTTLRSLPSFLPRALRAVARRPTDAPRRLSAGAGLPVWKERLTAGVRALALPRGRPDLCLVHDLTTATWFPWLRAVYPGVPVAMYYHGGENAGASGLDPDKVLRAFRGVDVVFTNTEFSRDHAVARGCPPEKVEIVPVGFSLDDYRPAALREYRPGGVLRLLTAGRVSEEKGHRFALEALAGLVAAGATDFRYTVVGDGYLRPSLERWAAENGLGPYVEFTGAVTTEALVAHVAGADAVLLPSIELGTWVENQACIVQEAMLMKAAVVATTAGGVPESLAPELHPYLVPPEDPAAIARALLALRALDDDGLRALGEAGRAFAEERYDIRRLNAALLERALHGSPRRAEPPAVTALA
ncbi:MAG TPA: glycosyltransferase family 4 protein [Longimicrobiaceae bacterium]|nr:glycosyltransferase family 4 protein [Longimicrobiaceae bacterium]